MKRIVLIVLLMGLIGGGIAYAQLNWDAEEERPSIKCETTPQKIEAQAGDTFQLTLHLTIPDGYKAYTEGKQVKPINIHPPYAKQSAVSSDETGEFGLDTKSDFGLDAESESGEDFGLDDESITTDDFGFEDESTEGAPAETTTTTTPIDQGVELLEMTRDKPGELHEEELLGSYRTVTKNIAYTLTYRMVDPSKLENGIFRLEIDYQLCTESLCIDGPTVSINIPHSSAGQFATGMSDTADPNASVTSDNPSEILEAGLPLPKMSDNPIDVDATFEKAREGSGWLDQLQASLLSGLQDNFKSNMLWAFFIALLTGIISVLLPCVWPLIPLTIGALMGQQTQGQPSSKLRSFGRASAYVLGIVSVFAILGLVAALLGEGAVRVIRHPALFAAAMALVVIIFIYLTFAMLGFYEIRMPKFLQSKKDEQSQKEKSLGNVFVFGLLAGVVASPCLTPIMGLILVIIISISSMEGMLLMVGYGIGFGIPFLLIGTFTSIATRAPRSGNWMMIIQYGFSLLMLVFIYLFLGLFLNAIGLGIYTLFLFALFLIVTAFLMGAHKFAKNKDNSYLKIRSFVGIFYMVIGVGLLVWGIIEPIQYYQQKSSVEATLAKGDWSYFHQIKTEQEYAQLLSQARKENKYLMLFFWDDACKYCEKYKHHVFPDPEFKKTAEAIIPVSIKISQTPSIAQPYKILGPPSIVFVDYNQTVMINRKINWEEADLFGGDEGSISKKGLSLIIETLTTR
jgi:thiol:disulfide interchange protein